MIENNDLKNKERWRRYVGIGAKQGSLSVQARKRMAIRSAVKGLYSL